MAKRTVLVSDISGKELAPTEAAKLTVVFADARRPMKVMDVSVEEANAILTDTARVEKPRGRKPKASVETPAEPRTRRSRTEKPAEEPVEA